MPSFWTCLRHDIHWTLDSLVSTSCTVKSSGNIIKAIKVTDMSIYQEAKHLNKWDKFFNKKNNQCSNKKYAWFLGGHTKNLNVFPSINYYVRHYSKCCNQNFSYHYVLYVTDIYNFNLPKCKFHVKDIPLRSDCDKDSNLFLYCCFYFYFLIYSPKFI